jgi:hypothetical protein
MIHPTVQEFAEAETDLALEVAIRIANRHNLRSGAADNPEIPGVNGVDLASTLEAYEATILGQTVVVWATDLALVDVLTEQANAYAEICPHNALADAIRWASRNFLMLVEVA